MFGTGAGRRGAAQPYDRRGLCRGACSDPGVRAVPLSGAADHRRRADPDGRAAQEDRRRHRPARTRSRSSRRPRAERQKAVDDAVGITAEALIAARGTRSCMSPGCGRASTRSPRRCASMGYSAKDFNPENCIYVGGGLKRRAAAGRLPRVRLRDVQHPAGAQLPELQHAGARAPACRAASEGGRYHVPPWMVPLMLDKDGDDAAAARPRRRDRGPRRVLRPVARRPLGRGDLRRQDLDRLSARAPAATRARRSATTSPAMPTSKATTRSAARAPSMLM